MKIYKAIPHHSGVRYCLEYFEKGKCDLFRAVQASATVPFVSKPVMINGDFNKTVDLLEKQAENGEIFLIAPSKPVEVTRFDGDMDKLGDLYWLGWNDMSARIDELKGYLNLLRATDKSFRVQVFRVSLKIYNSFGAVVLGICRTNSLLATV